MRMSEELVEMLTFAANEAITTFEQTAPLTDDERVYMVDMLFFAAQRIEDRRVIVRLISLTCEYCGGDNHAEENCPNSKR